MGHHVVTANAFGNATLLNPRNCCVNAVSAIGGATASFIQFFDAAATTDVTLGTTQPVYVLSVGIGAAVEGLVGAEAQFINGIVVASTSAAVGTATLSASVRAWIS